MRRIVVAAAMFVTGEQAGVAAPIISEAFASRFQISAASPIGDLPGSTQVAFGPDGRLYSTQFTSEIVSYAYNPTTGALTDKQSAGVSGFGFAFATHAVPGAASQSYLYVADSPNFEGIITRFGNSNANARWGEAGEVNVDIVRGVPIGNHTLDHMQISGTQLFVGIGARTSNGRSGLFTGQNFHDEPSGPVGGGYADGGDGFTYGETSYNGAIGTIRDLSAVPNVPNAAQLRDGPNGTTGNLLAGRDAFLPGAPHAQLPYTSTANDRLVVHSAGTRNPFGLALDESGALWFTNNFGRADTNGDGTSNPHLRDGLDDDLSNDVHDQLFRAVAGGDYRYDNTNFRGTATFPNQTVTSTTFDNLEASHPNFGDLHDPANPDGLGPSSSANGLDFGSMDLTGLLASDAQEYAVVSRWNGVVSELPPGTDAITFKDVVVVDPETGFTRRLAEGFANPIDVESDGNGGFLIADWGFPGTIWRISPRVAASRWNLPAGGAWSSASSWSGPVPDGVGAVANLTGAATGPAGVNVDGPKILGTLNFDNTAAYVLAGAGSLTIDVAAGFGVINAIKGAHRIEVPVHLARNTTISVRQGASLVMAGDQSSAAGVALTKSGPGTLAVKHLRSDQLFVSDGTAAVLPNGTASGVSRVQSMAITGSEAPAATLDLTDNAIIVDYTGQSPLATLTALIAYARNNGAWDQAGITSSAAAANSAAGAIGVAEAATIGLTEFGGMPVDSDAVVIRYTRIGDANLDGITEIGDFSLLAVSFNLPTGWSGGDFNYDGVTDIGDFSLLAANFGQTAPPAEPLAWTRSQVPEPSAIAAGLPGAVASLSMRRRRGVVI